MAIVDPQINAVSIAVLRQLNFWLKRQVVEQTDASVGPSERQVSPTKGRRGSRRQSTTSGRSSAHL